MASSTKNVLDDDLHPIPKPYAQEKQPQQRTCPSQKPLYKEAVKRKSHKRSEAIREQNQVVLSQFDKNIQ